MKYNVYSWSYIRVVQNVDLMDYDRFTIHLQILCTFFYRGLFRVDLWKSALRNIKLNYRSNLFCGVHCNGILGCKRILYDIHDRPHKLYIFIQIATYNRNGVPNCLGDHDIFQRILYYTYSYSIKFMSCNVYCM